MVGQTKIEDNKVRTAEWLNKKGVRKFLIPFLVFKYRFIHARNPIF